jgi:TRAP-type transport system periplasmic protein
MKILTLKLIVVLLILFPLEQVYSQTIKIGSLAPDGSAWYNALRDMGEEWERVTDGKVKINIYPGGVAGDEVDMVRKMRIGQLHAAAITDVGLSSIISEINAFQMPMMFNSYGELDYVRDKLAPKLEELLENKGFIVLNWGDAGWVHIFSQKPVIYPNDLKIQNQKIFVWAGATESFNAWKAAGFHPVEVASTDMFMSLQTKLINAFPTTPLIALSYQYFALAKNMSDLPYAPLSGATIITKEKWEQIPADIRPELLKAARSSGERLRKQVRDMDNEAIKVMEKHGLIIQPIPPEARKEWRDMTVKYLYPEMLSRVVPQEMYEETLKLLQEYRTQHAKSIANE